MPQSRSRRVTIAVLSVLTILLLGLAVFIALRLQTPDTSVADCEPGWSFCAGCINACRFTNSGTSCNEWIDQECGGACQGDGATCGSGCCAGLQCCSNGRCGVNCIGPSTTSTPPSMVCSPNTFIKFLAACGAAGCPAGQRLTEVCKADGSGTVGACISYTACQASTTTTSTGTTTTPGGGVADGSCVETYSINGYEAVATVPSASQDPDCTAPVAIETFSGPSDATCSSNKQVVEVEPGTSVSRGATCGGNCAQVDGPNGGIRVDNTSICTSSSSSSGTSSSGGGAYTCNSMTRIPTGSPLPPGQTVSVQVTETSSTANNAACVFLVDGSNAQVAQSTRTGGPTAGPNNTWTHNYNIAIPGGAANGNYSLRYSRSCAMGALEAAAACQQAFTVTAGVQENPALSLIKSSAVVTLPNGNANINYTITITNSGNVAATISPVVDVLPVQVTSASQVTATNPQASQITADAITWNGPFTVNPNSSIQFTYTLSFTAAEIAAFTSNQLINTVTITNTGTGGGTLSFTLLTLLGALPATGLFDEPAGLMVVGLILIMIGLIINRSGILLNLFGAGVGSTDATTKLVESFLRGETEENRKDKFAAKVVSQQEKKYRK